MPLTVSHHRLIHTYLLHWGVRLCAPLISETSQAEERKRDSELRASRGAHLPPKNMRVLLDSCVSSMVSETLEGSTETPVVTLIVTYRV